jgi:hypothetical protein
MEAIEVTANFSIDGNLIPLEFIREGKTYPVISTGRHWEDEKGIHILVMVPDETVHELVFSPREISWFFNPRHGHVSSSQA